MNLQPDFVIETDRAILIADVKVTIEHTTAMSTVKSENERKYEALREHFSLRGKPTYTTTLMFGSLGSIPMTTRQAIKAIIRNERKANSTIRHLSQIAIHYARNIVVHHLSGADQPY